MKPIYIDVETTGLDAQRHGIVQVAAIYERADGTPEKINIQINPDTYMACCEYDEKALEINGRTIEDIQAGDGSINDFIAFLEQARVDIGISKLTFAGYNTQFDIGFIKNWMKQSDIGYSSYFNHYDLDVFALVKHMRYIGIIDAKNLKLATICECYDIDIYAHDALSDIEATLNLHKHLLGMIVPSI